MDSANSEPKNIDAYLLRSSVNNYYKFTFGPRKAYHFRELCIKYFPISGIIKKHKLPLLLIQVLY